MPGIELQCHTTKFSGMTPALDRGEEFIMKKIIAAAGNYEWRKMIKIG